MTLDLVDAEHRFGLDYQGDHHRTDRAQYRRDQNKLSRLAAAGWTVFSVTQLDLSDELHRAAFAMNVAHALSSIVGRPIGVTTRKPASLGCLTDAVSLGARVRPPAFRMIATPRCCASFVAIGAGILESR